MKFSKTQFLRAYVIDFRRRKFVYVFVGLMLSIKVGDAMKWKSNFSDWFIILPIIFSMPFIFNVFIALYRAVRRHFGAESSFISER